MKKFIALIVVLGIGVGGYYGWKNWQKANPTSAAPERPTTATAELRSINFAVNAAGEIAPAEQVSVRPEINGKVDTLPVDLGDRVKKGDLLFKLDDKELQQQRASNLTDIEKAKLNLEKAERDYKRAQQLLADKLISQELYDDTKTAYDLAKNALESAQRALALTDEHLTKTEVRAPFDCTVLTRPVSIGQAVSGSGRLQRRHRSAHHRRPQRHDHQRPGQPGRCPPPQGGRDGRGHRRGGGRPAGRRARSSASRPRRSSRTTSKATRPASC